MTADREAFARALDLFEATPLGQRVLAAPVMNETRNTVVREGRALIAELTRMAAMNDELATATRALLAENERLREINSELVTSYNGRLVETAKLLSENERLRDLLHALNHPEWEP